MRLDALINFFVALMPLLDSDLMPTEQAQNLARPGRELRFREGNDRIWGKDNWIQCRTCPRDSRGFQVFHHKDAHS